MDFKVGTCWYKKVRWMSVCSKYLIGSESSKKNVHENSSQKSIFQLEIVIQALLHNCTLGIHFVTKIPANITIPTAISFLH